MKGALCEKKDLKPYTARAERGRLETEVKKFMQLLAVVLVTIGAFALPTFAQTGGGGGGTLMGSVNVYVTDDDGQEVSGYVALYKDMVTG